MIERVVAIIGRAAFGIDDLDPPVQRVVAVGSDVAQRVGNPTSPIGAVLGS
jgi:hypothetical protein